MTDRHGELLAELECKCITGGATRNGQAKERGPTPSAPSRKRPQESAQWTEEIFIPRHAGQQYTECSYIYNPIHTERSVALAAGLPDIILHGSATKAHALTSVISRLFDGDATRITRLCGQLRAMVLMDTTIKVQCMGTNKQDDELQVFYRVLNAHGEPAIANGVIGGTAS